MIPAPRDGCDATRANLEAFVLGQTEAAESSFVASHLSGCEACRREHAEVRTFLAELAGIGAKKRVAVSRPQVRWIRRSVAAAGVVCILWLASRSPHSGLEFEGGGERAGADFGAAPARNDRSRLLLEALLEAQRPDGTWAAPSASSMASDVTALAALALVRASNVEGSDRVADAARRGLETLGAPAVAARRPSPSQRLSTAVEALALVEGAGRHVEVKEKARTVTAYLVRQAAATGAGRSALLDAVEAAVFESAARARLRVPGLDAARESMRTRLDAARGSSQAASFFGGLDAAERDRTDRTVALLIAAFGALADPAAPTTRLDRALETWSALPADPQAASPLEAATHLLALTARP